MEFLDLVGFNFLIRKLKSFSNLIVEVMHSTNMHSLLGIVLPSLHWYMVDA